MSDIDYESRRSHHRHHHHHHHHRHKKSRHRVEEVDEEIHRHKKHRVDESDDEAYQHKKYQLDEFDDESYRHKKHRSGSKEKEKDKFREERFRKEERGRNREEYTEENREDRYRKEERSRYREEVVEETRDKNREERLRKEERSRNRDDAEESREEKPRQEEASGSREDVEEVSDKEEDKVKEKHKKKKKKKHSSHRKEHTRDGEVSENNERPVEVKREIKQEPQSGPPPAESALKKYEEKSGKLAEDTNMFNGIVVKYSEPPEARKPKRRWRLYPFKGEQALPILHIHRQSAFLLGRERRVCDIPIDHPSCSKQHAALQYRLVPFTREDGRRAQRIRLYIIDLESANGTFVNNQRIEAKKYVELLEKDVIKFGFSSREYVLLHEHSKDSEDDDDM